MPEQVEQNEKVEYSILGNPAKCGGHFRDSENLFFFLQWEVLQIILNLITTAVGLNVAHTIL